MPGMWDTEKESCRGNGFRLTSEIDPVHPDLCPSAVPFKGHSTVGAPVP